MLCSEGGVRSLKEEKCDINEAHPGGELEKKSTNPVYFETCDVHNIVFKYRCMHVFNVIFWDRKN